MMMMMMMMDRYVNDMIWHALAHFCSTTWPFGHSSPFDQSGLPFRTMHPYRPS
jgi:hypothetical protein